MLASASAGTGKSTLAQRVATPHWPDYEREDNQRLDREASIAQVLAIRIPISSLVGHCRVFDVCDVVRDGQRAELRALPVSQSRRTDCTKQTRRHEGAAGGTQ